MKIHSLLFLLSLTLSHALYGWGERGHHVLCEVATRLVANPELSEFLQGRGHQAGHVCNIPDILWRNLPAQDKAGENSHFLDPEPFGYTLDTLPLVFADIATAKGVTRAKLAVDLGSLWWRADQFFRRAKANATAIGLATLPTSAQLQDNSHPYNQAVYQFFTDLYLMGHFAGDASMPYHNTSDYDGWQKGRGGIHSYFESAAVTAQPLQLAEWVYQAAVLLRAQSGVWTSATQKIRAVSIQAMREMPELDALDVLVKPSVAATKTAAKRPPVKESAKRFKSLLVKELARSAALLAEMWDAAYEAGGKPNLKVYRSYRYPLMPDYVPLDYTASRMGEE